MSLQLNDFRRKSFKSIMFPKNSNKIQEEEKLLL